MYVNLFGKLRMKRTEYDNEIEICLNALRSYHQALNEVVRCRTELGDIQLKFQPVQAHRTDEQVIKSYKRDNHSNLYAKMEQEKEVQKDFDYNNAILDKCSDIMHWILDPVEREQIEFRYMKSVYANNRTFGDKYNYDERSVYKHIRGIVRKAIIRKRKNLWK